MFVYLFIHLFIYVFVSFLLHTVFILFFRRGRLTRKIKNNFEASCLLLGNLLGYQTPFDTAKLIHSTTTSIKELRRRIHIESLIPPCKHRLYKHWTNSRAQAQFYEQITLHQFLSITSTLGLLVDTEWTAVCTHLWEIIGLPRLL